MVYGLPAHGEANWDAKVTASIEYLKANRAISVKDYGAKGDGVTDDTAAIQAGINAGVHLYFPTGTYLASGLVAKPGMHLSGAGKGDPDTVGTPRTVIQSVTGALFSSGSNFCTIEHIELTAPAAAAGDVITGSWSQGVFRNVRLRQYAAANSVVNVTGWLDMTIEGGSEIICNGDATASAFKAVSGSGNIAQVSFRDTRFTGGRQYPLWLEATGGGVSVVTGVSIDNVNFEVARNGCIKLLSCRNVKIRASGDWDRDDYSLQDRIYIGASATGPGAASGQISIEGWTRDNTLALDAAAYDIKAESATFDLDIIGGGHQNTGVFLLVNAGSATGRVVGQRVTLTNGTNMDTDGWQTYTPTISPTVQGNGTLTGKYRRRGKMVEYEISFTVGSTTTIGSMQLTLPPVTPTGPDQPLIAVALKQGVGYYMLTGFITGTTLYVQTVGASGAMGNVGGASPFSWAANDQLTVRGSYRVA